MTNWDDEIDAVARTMTEGEPDGALEARVLARIDRPRWNWRSPWILSPIAVAAVLMIAVMLVRLKPAPTTEVRPKPDAATEVRLKPDTTGTTGAQVRLKPDTTVTGVGSGFSRTVVPIVARNDDTESLVPAPLEIEPLGVESVDAMETIQIERLSVALLEVPAIGEQ